MTVPTSTPPLPAPELLRSVAQNFQPNPRRIPFRNLQAFRDSIATLRAKGASYAVIADLLREHGVKTSRARVAEYGRTVLEKQKPRKRRKPPLSSGVPTTITSALPAPPPPTQVVEQSSILPSSNRTRGPRIANVRMLKPNAP